MAADSLLSTIRFLIVYLQPFFYGAATRLPFIYYVIHLDDHFGKTILDTFGSKWLPIGFFVAAYQFARVLTNILSLWVPRVSHMLGTALGLSGYALVLATDKDNLITFVVGTVMVGFSETMSSMQGYAKHEYHEQLLHLQRTLKIQYACVMFGVMFAFLLGGVVYRFTHINGVATFGVIVLGIELVGTAAYFVINASRGSTGTTRTRSSVGPDSLSRTSSELNASMRNSVRKLVMVQAFQTSAYTARVEIDRFSKGGQRANWLAYLLAITIGVEAITIGYNLSVGPIFLLKEFGADVSIIGILFAAGASTGTFVATSITLTPVGVRLMRRYVPAPFNIYIAMTGIGCSVLLAAVPVMGIHIFGLLMLMGFNDLAATLLIEVQAAITSNASYRIVGPTGQIVRRTLNSITAITGPLLFGIWPRAPHVVAGVITLVWTAIFIIAVERRRRFTRSILNTVLPTAKLFAINNMSWEAQEIACQIAEGYGKTQAVAFVQQASMPSTRMSLLLTPWSNLGAAQSRSDQLKLFAKQSASRNDSGLYVESSADAGGPTERTNEVVEAQPDVEDAKV